MTATADVTRVLWRDFATLGWAGLAEVSTPALMGERSRRCDLLFIRRNTRPGRGLFETLAIEVKTSRPDFLRDIKHPEKQAPWREITHGHAYAAPSGLLRPEEVPADSGLYLVDTVPSVTPGGSVEIVTEAKVPPRTPADSNLSGWLIWAITQRASWAEAEDRGWSASGQNLVGQLRHENALLRASYRTMEREVEALEAELEAARRGVSA